MNGWQKLVTVGVGVVGLATVLKGWQKIKQQKSFDETPLLSWLGIFVWGDTLIIGMFWVATSIVGLIFRKWVIFLLCVSVFWIVRSMGEIIYWISQQFSAKNRNPPERLFGYKWVKNEAIWFLYQLYWQIVMVVGIVATIIICKNL